MIQNWNHCFPVHMLPTHFVPQMYYYQPVPSQLSQHMMTMTQFPPQYNPYSQMWPMTNWVAPQPTIPQYFNPTLLEYNIPKTVEMPLSTISPRSNEKLLSSLAFVTEDATDATENNDTDETYCGVPIISSTSEQER